MYKAWEKYILDLAGAQIITLPYLSCATLSLNLLLGAGQYWTG